MFIILSIYSGLTALQQLIWFFIALSYGYFVWGYIVWILVWGWNAYAFVSHYRYAKLIKQGARNQIQT